MLTRKKAKNKDCLIKWLIRVRTGVHNCYPHNVHVNTDVAGCREIAAQSKSAFSVKKKRNTTEDQEKDNEEEEESEEEDEEDEEEVEAHDDPADLLAEVRSLSFLTRNFFFLTHRSRVSYSKMPVNLKVCCSFLPSFLLLSLRCWIQRCPST
jgi:hypothetical protein